MSELERTVRCWIYKSTRQDEMYLYLNEEGSFDDVPDALLARLGRLEFVLELELYEERKLARAEAADVMRSLRERGWFLQMPPVQNSSSGHEGD